MLNVRCYNCCCRVQVLKYVDAIEKMLLNQCVDNVLWLTDYLGGILQWNALSSKCSNDGVGDSEVDDDDDVDTNAEYRYD